MLQFRVNKSQSQSKILSTHTHIDTHAPHEREEGPGGRQRLVQGYQSTLGSPATLSQLRHDSIFVFQDQPDLIPPHNYKLQTVNLKLIIHNIMDQQKNTKRIFQLLQCYSIQQIVASQERIDPCLYFTWFSLCPPLVVFFLLLQSACSCLISRITSGSSVKKYDNKNQAIG